jgi:PKD repeat protein
VLRAKITSGMMDGLNIGDPSDVNSPEHQLLAYESATESIVLLKNNAILPLNTTTINEIAVIGPLADDGNAMRGDQFMVSSEVTPPYTVSVLEGITNKVGGDMVINYSKGCDVNSCWTHLFPQAINAAERSDVVVYVGGIDHTMEGESTDRVGGSIEIPGKQADLINVLAQVNDKVIAVLIGSGGIGVSSFIDSVEGALMAWYPGQEVGNAIADIIFGDVNPSGKLPLTMAVNDAQLPDLTFDFSRDLIDGVGYPYYEKNQLEPQFAFGYGLSYTQFEINNLSLSPQYPNAGEPVYASVDVKNIGAREGAEVVQLYVKNHTTTVSMPPKQLKGFQKVSLSPGELQTITFRLTTDELSYYDPSTKKYIVEAGRYTAMVGNASDNILASADFNVESAEGNKLPQAVINASTQAGYAPLTVSFDGSASSDSDGTIVSYSWDFGDGTTATGETATHEYTQPGMYTATLTTMDEDGVTDTANILISSSSLNLALNKRAYVSSQQNNSDLTGSNAVDGDSGTRWSSDWTDNEWIFIDMGGQYTINEVVLKWELASGKKYKIQISDDAENWDDLFYEGSGNGGEDMINVSGTGRYVRMLGLQKNFLFGGYSLYEFEIY